IGREAHLFKGAGPETFDQHGRSRNKLPDQRHRLIMTEFDAEAALVARVHLPSRLDILGAPAAKRVAFTRLDLDDIGAEISEMLRQQIAGNEPRKIDDPKPGQRATDARRVVPARQSGL